MNILILFQFAFAQMQTIMFIKDNNYVFGIVNMKIIEDNFKKHIVCCTICNSKIELEEAKELCKDTLTDTFRIRICPCCGIIYPKVNILFN